MHCSGSVKWYSCCGSQLGSSSKESARDSVIPFLAYTQKNWKQVFKQIVYAYVSNSAISSS